MNLISEEAVNTFLKGVSAVNCELLENGERIYETREQV